MDSPLVDNYILSYATLICNYAAISLSFLVTILLLSILLGQNYTFKKREAIWGIVFPFYIYATTVMTSSVVMIINVAIYAFQTNESGGSIAAEETGDWLEAQMTDLGSGGILMTISVIAALLAFLYVAVYFFVINKNKRPGSRLLRTIEGTLVFYIVRSYIGSLIYNIYYAVIGDADEFEQMLMIGDDSVSLTSQIIYLAVIISIFLLLYLAVYKKGKRINLKRRYALIFILWTLLLTYLPNLPFRSGLSDDARIRMMQIIIAIIVPVIGLAVPVILFMIVGRESLLEKNAYQASYIDAELEYIRQYKKSEQETRAFRHDIINNLSIMNILMDEGKVEQAHEHMKDLLGNVSALSPKYVTGDEMLDCIVSMKAEKMKERGIGFEADGVIDGGLRMKPVDAAGLFANAFDNAIEATEELRNAGGDISGGIRFNITRTDRYFVMKLSNPYIAAPEVSAAELFSGSGGYTSKDDRSLHGFGIRNMKACIERYSGMISAADREGRFELIMMLPREA